MSTFLRCDESVTKIAEAILHEYPCYEPLIEAGVKIDFVFAYPNYDENTGEPQGVALKHHGCRALGIARKIGLKDRALGRGDAEISIDGEWWKEATDEERKALLDHELYHLKVRMRDGVIMRDDLKRPLLELRPHDFEFGWFAAVAARHGVSSQEQQQASQMMDKAGQFFWPEVVGSKEPLAGATVTIKSGDKKVVMAGQQFRQAAAMRGGGK